MNKIPEAVTNIDTTVTTITSLRSLAVTLHLLQYRIKSTSIDFIHEQITFLPKHPHVDSPPSNGECKTLADNIQRTAEIISDLIGVELPMGESQHVGNQDRSENLLCQIKENLEEQCLFIEKGLNQLVLEYKTAKHLCNVVFNGAEDDVIYDESGEEDVVLGLKDGNLFKWATRCFTLASIAESDLREIDNSLLQIQKDLDWEKEVSASQQDSVTPTSTNMAKELGYSRSPKYRTDAP